MDNAPALLEQVQGFPSIPGVYLMKDREGNYIYIGKAIHIRNRVKSYFLQRNDGRYQIPFLLKRVESIEWIATNNEAEALILEANLIRLHKPMYNMQLKDDKHYPYLKITVKEPFPRLLKVRKVEQDGALYFGPFTDVRALNSLLHQTRRIFRIRQCNKRINGTSGHANTAVRPCINFAMHHCSGACGGKISSTEYQERVAVLIRFLKGHRKDILERLQTAMNDAAMQLDFEQAGLIRDQIRLITRDSANRSIVDLKAVDTDIDVFGIHETAHSICLCVLMFRQGILSAKRHFLLKRHLWDAASADRDYVIIQYYLASVEDPPDEIIVPYDKGFNGTLLESWFQRQKAKKMEVTLPVRGLKVDLLQLAEKNAELYLLQKAPAEPPSVLHELKQILNLPKLPVTIEAFDISNLGPLDAVAGMVRYCSGKPDTAEYRRFRIKGVSGQNDFAMLMEAVARRLSRLAREGKPFPDLLLIDGGKGQLSAAMKPLEQFSDPPMVVALAKREETLFSPYCEAPVQLPGNHAVRLLAERIRNEVHRYALAYHKKLRNRRTKHSLLESVPGIGPERARSLLVAFGSVKRIKETPVAEIAAVKGFNPALAEKLVAALREK